VTTIELTRKIVRRLGKLKLLILLAGIVLAGVLFLYAKRIPVVYTAKASVFPLTASNDNSGASSLLSTLTGVSDAPKSFSQEASINIVELATSRTTREAVAMERVPELGNKRIAELLIESMNKTKSFLAASTKEPKNDTTLRAIGGTIIRDGMTAKINKNGILELTFSSTDKDIISPISYILIDKISQFYKDLKVKKARFDYDFTVRKMDSLNVVLDSFDRKAIHMANTTLFVPEERIEFTIPKENLINDKGRVVRQRDAAANNREEALWRWQKVTPIIETLDKPDAPFEEKRSSAVMFAVMGFILGCFLSCILLVADIIYKYINAEINNAVFGGEAAEAVAETNASATTTTTASPL
jgi:hypothetical protein